MYYLLLLTTATHCYSLLLATARYCSLLLTTAHYCSLLLTTTHYSRYYFCTQVAMHLRAIFATPKWLSEHAHMKIHEMVVLYIDKDEIVWPAGEPPTYSTFKDISKRYSFWMRPGHGRVGGARYSCHCPACCLAFETGEGMDNLLDIANCERRHLNRYETRRGCYRHGYEEATIVCTQATGQVNAKSRAKDLWQELKRLLKAGKFAAVQARELWSTEERVHMRPGHFWACELGDAGDLLADAATKGSPILAGPFKGRQVPPAKFKPTPTSICHLEPLLMPPLASAYNCLPWPILG